MAEILTYKIPGLNVYGVQQVSYAVDGKTDADYGTVLAAATLQQANTIEKESEAFSSMVRLRARKLEELGDALSVLSKAFASLPTSGRQRPSDLSQSDSALKQVDAVLRKYELAGLDLQIERDSSGYETSWKATREALTLRKNDLQYAIDKENNTLQQDMISLQSLVKKRDNSFSTASRLLKKINTTAKTVIANVGE